MKHQALLNWLDQELGTRGWSDNQFAIKAQLGTGTMPRLRKGIAPSIRMCEKIGRALNEPLVAVLKRAGLVPYQAGVDSPERDELTSLINALTDDEVREYIDLVRFLQKQKLKPHQSSKKS
jgi:hypothetical protein